MVTVAKRKDIDPTFGRRLKELREAAGLTQAALAERLDMDPANLARLEAGRREPGWQTVLKVAEALGARPNDFLTPEPEPAPRKPRRRA